MLLEQMSRALGLPTAFVRALALTASHRYKQYTIPKRTGGQRLIFHPSKELKTLQRWLLRAIILKLPVHDCAVAYRTGINIADNARRHTKSRYLLRMDLTDFFPSITDKDLRLYASRTPELATWSAGEINLACHILFRGGRLAIGAPTSPAVSNALCYDLDVKLEQLARQSRVTYTRYADDLFFSCAAPDRLRQLEPAIAATIAALDCPGQLTVNASKTRHTSAKRRRRVTGIVLDTAGGISVGRDIKRRVRALVHKYESLDGEQRKSLAGTLAFMKGVEPDAINRLILKYGHALVTRAMRNS